MLLKAVIVYVKSNTYPYILYPKVFQSLPYHCILLVSYPYPYMRLCNIFMNFHKALSTL